MKTDSIKSKYIALNKSFDVIRYCLTACSVFLFLFFLGGHFEFVILGPLSVFILSGMIFDIVFLDIFGGLPDSENKKNFSDTMKESLKEPNLLLKRRLKLRIFSFIVTMSIGAVIFIFDEITAKTIIFFGYFPIISLAYFSLKYIFKLPMLPLIYPDNILLNGSIQIPIHQGGQTSQDIALETMLSRNAILSNVYDIKNPGYVFNVFEQNSIYNPSNPIYKH